MRFWDDHPEIMEEISHLPLNQQNAAMREAMSQHDVARVHCHRSLLNRSGATPPSPEPPAGAEPRPLDASAGHSFDHCDVCGAPRGKHHLSYCDLRGDE